MWIGLDQLLLDLKVHSIYRSTDFIIFNPTQSPHVRIGSNLLTLEHPYTLEWSILKNF